MVGAKFFTLFTKLSTECVEKIRACADPVNVYPEGIWIGFYLIPMASGLNP